MNTELLANSLLILCGVTICISIGMFIGWWLFHPDKNQLNKLIKENKTDIDKLNQDLDNMVEFNVNSIAQI